MMEYWNTNSLEPSILWILSLFKVQKLGFRVFPILCLHSQQDIHYSSISVLHYSNFTA